VPRLLLPTDRERRRDDSEVIETPRRSRRETIDPTATD
jgi:hypothetical protein